MKPIDKWVPIDIETRRATISAEKAEPQRHHRIHEFRNSSIDLPVIRISIQILMYRVANYRTNLHQLKWMRLNGANESYFKLGEENESVQKVQHQFLWELATTEKETISSIVERLKLEKQREPLLISATGVVINGNRRLAAMRELYFDDPELYSTFGDIDCMVLPDYATEDDFKEIEVRLQMTPETRLPYDWIGECMAIKDLRANNVEFDEIANWMRMETSKVKNKLLILNEIDMYLKDWRGKELDYDYLKDAEEIVTQICRKIKSKEGAQQEIARRVGWLLLDQKGNDGRIYELREVTGTLTNDLVSKLQEVYPEEIRSGGESGSSNNEELELDIDLEDQDEDIITDQSILTFLNLSKNNDALQKEIVNLCKVVVETKKAQRSGETAKRAVQDAHTSLLEVDLTNASPTTYAAIQKQLEQIENRVTYLKEQLRKLIQSQSND